MTNVSRNAGAVIGQIVITSLLMFVLYREMLEIIGLESIGIWSVVLAAASASRLTDLGLSASVTRFVALHRSGGRQQEASEAIQTVFVSTSLILSVLLIASYPLLSYVFRFFLSDVDLLKARALLPFSLLSLYIASAAGVFLAAIDGCQRQDIRVIIVVLGQVIYVLTGLWLMRSFQLIGLAWAQIFQGLSLLVASWILLRRQQAELPLVPFVWKKKSFLEMLSYGLQFQLGSIVMMLFDPLTKAMLARYGGVGAVGYFEMASQLVTRVRALIVSANQVVVPLIASVYQHDVRHLEKIFNFSMELLFLVIGPIFALLILWSPLISELWLGTRDEKFTAYVTILSIAWGFNVIAGPAYFANQGTGKIGWNSASHVWIGVANVLLGWSLGKIFGAWGVLSAMAIALVSGSLVILLSYCTNIKDRKHWRLSWQALLVMLVSITIVMLSEDLYLFSQPFDGAIQLLILIFLPSLVLGLCLWMHPFRKLILSNIFP